MSKHTKGPWSRDKWGNIKTASGETLRLHGVALPCGGRQSDHEEVEANSDLVTAAPDLLEALKGMCAIVKDSRGVAGYHLNGDTAEWDEFDEVDAALAAIAKATGEQA